jgi:hypothetical protein
MLHVATTTEERLASAEVRACLEEGLRAHGAATLLVPSFADQLVAQKELSAYPSLSLGVTVSTPSAWAKERWEVWGDGTHVVDPLVRTIAVQRAIAQAPREIGRGVALNAGTVQLLSSLVGNALPWLPLDPAGEPNELVCHAAGLTDAEMGVVALAGEYARITHGAGYIEESEAMVRVVDAMADGLVGPGCVVAAGFGETNRPTRDLLASLACAGELTIVTQAGNDAALEGQRAAVELVEEVVAARGGSISREEKGACSPTAPPRRASELQQVVQSIFGIEGSAKSTGAVEVLEPAGPLAEAELVASRVAELAKAGAREVVVVAADAERAWRELSPKLFSRGVTCEAELVSRVDQLEAGRAFLEFASSVAQLSELAATWPASQTSPEGELVVLGDMAWWPPRALADFLRQDIAHVPTERAVSLDRSWRADRLLTPTDVLDMLQNPKATSSSVAAATRELLRGRVGSAASKLLAPYLQAGGEAPADLVPDEAGLELLPVAPERNRLEDERAIGVLDAVLGIAGTLKDLGVTADPAVPNHVSLSTLVELCAQAMSQTSVIMRPGAWAGDGACRCRIYGRSRAAGLVPLSADALVSCSMTSAEWPADTGDDVLSALLERLGIEPKADPAARERSIFWRMLRVPRESLVVERCGVDASGSPCYPAVMLTELLSCYSADSSVPARSLGEDQADANLSTSGRGMDVLATDDPSPAGSISGANAALVVVPPTGRVDLVEGKPLLSASQIESYLECPYKWFSLRRLRLQDSDAGFGPMEMGTFAHRVLEVTHSRLLAEARERAGVVEGERLDPWVMLPGSRVSEDDEEGLAHAHEVLLAEFDEHLRHQSLRPGKRSRYQAFVPHDAADEAQLAQLRRDLEAVLDYEAGLFLGYEPRFFEWDFGTQGEPVEYAGAWICGTIDRVDVDAHQQAVVIDYKHKGPNGFAKEYGVTPVHEVGDAVANEADEQQALPYGLPRRVQSLIYGQVVRRMHPELKVRAAVYLGTRGSHAVGGAIAEDSIDRVLGKHTPLREGSLSAYTVSDDDSYGIDGESGMDAYLDATEAAIADKVAQLLAGNVEAHPLDAAACSFCPVMNCERRLS